MNAVCTKVLLPFFPPVCTFAPSLFSQLRLTILWNTKWPLILGWSEPAATNAPVEDAPIQPVLRMNILPARRDFFFHLLFAPKFSTSPLLPPPSYLPPTNPTPPHSITRAPETSSGCGARVGVVAVERKLERLELDRLELERDPCAHKKVRCLCFFFVFFCFFSLKKV